MTFQVAKLRFIQDRVAASLQRIEEVSAALDPEGDAFDKIAALRSELVSTRDLVQRDLDATAPDDEVRARAAAEQALADATAGRTAPERIVPSDHDYPLI